VGFVGKRSLTLPITPCFVDFFVLTPICASLECGQSSLSGNAWYAVYNKEGKFVENLSVSMNGWEG